MERENRASHSTAILTSVVANMFSKSGFEYTDFLPFPAPRRFLSIEESAALLDRMFQTTAEKNNDD
jgi:hypothetical protein